MTSSTPMETPEEREPDDPDFEAFLAFCRAPSLPALPKDEGRAKAGEEKTTPSIVQEHATIPSSPDYVTIKDFDNKSVLGYRINSPSTADDDEGKMTHFKIKRRSRTSIYVVDDTDKLAGYGFHLFKNVWVSCLAMAGLFDILAYVLPDFVKSSVVIDAGDEAPSEKSAEQPFAANTSFPPFFLDFVRWLDEHSEVIYFLFSLLWFVNAFFTAHDRRRRVLIEEERRLLFGVGNKKWRKTPWGAYYSSIVLQFLLLPIGFYFTVFCFAKQLFYNGERGEKLVLAITDQVGSVELNQFSIETDISLIGAIMRHFSHSMARAANAHIGSITKNAKSRAVKKVLGKAVRNPYRFRKELRSFLTLVRRIRYLVPLIGAGNKLLGNCLETLKRWKLRAHARRVRRAHQLVWGKKKKTKVTKTSAAIVIQTAFRAYWARKVKRCTMLLKGCRESLAVQKAQRRFREILKIARKRVAAKHRRLERLERMRKKNSERMSEDDKRSMYQLQDELGKEAKELLNRKLLLRPNTKFAIYWKVFFIVAILWEITQKAVEPLLHSYKKKKSDVPMTMEEFVAKTFVPTLASDLPTCREMKKGDVRSQSKSKSCSSEAGETNHKMIPWYCLEPFAGWQEGYRDFVALALIPAPVSVWPECRERKKGKIDRTSKRSRGESRPWYCLGPHPARHAIYRWMANLMLQNFRYFLGTVMFLDVFVTFFTGRFDPKTGELIPAHWFMRWIAPGLVLQLILNPNVADVSDIVYRSLQKMVEIGPYRTYRYFVAVIFPFAYGTVYLFLECLWLPMVQYENTAGVISSPSANQLWACGAHKYNTSTMKNNN